MVTKVATQGIYKTVNTKKVNELKGVKIVIRALFKDVKWEDDVKTERVETTVSLAVIPVINAVEALQSSKPNGLNNGEKIEQIIRKNQEGGKSDLTVSPSWQGSYQWRWIPSPPGRGSEQGY